MNNKLNKFTTYWRGNEISNFDQLINKFEKLHVVNLPKSYKKFKKLFNNVSINQNYFDFINKNKKEDSRSIYFFNFGEENEVSESINEEQEHLNDPIYYGVPGLVSFASTAEGDTMCFDYREDKKTCEPKIILLVHDEYEKTNGVDHMKIEHIANSFDEFLDMLYEFKDEDE